MMVPSFPRLSETFVAYRFLGLLRRGIDVHIACRRVSMDDWGFFPGLSEPGVIDRIHVRRAISGRNERHALSAVRLVAAVIGSPLLSATYLLRGSGGARYHSLRSLAKDPSLFRLRPDVMHFEFGHQAASEIGLIRALACRTVVSFQGADISYVGLDDDTMYEELWEEVDVLHFPSDDLRQRALRRGFDGSIPHVVIPPVMDLEGFVSIPDRRVPEGRLLRILSVGRLHWKKGYEYGLQAIRLLRDQGVPCEYRIVGEGEFRGAIERACRQLGLEKITRLMGPLSPNGVREQMAWADVLLHAAVSEGFGCAVVEAQATGLPVVASDADGLRETVLNEVTGFVVPRRDPNELAAKLATLARDRQLFVQMSRRAKQRAYEEFDGETVLKRFDELYRNIHAAHYRKSVLQSSDEPADTDLLR